MTSTLLGTYKLPLYADLDGQPRVGTLRVPLDLAGEGLRVEPLTPDVILHTDRHDGCPGTIGADLYVEAPEGRTVVGRYSCCPTCHP